MKKIVNFNSSIFIAVLLLAASSCKKDSLLNQIPPTSLSDASFWTSASDLQFYVNQFYSDGSIFPLYIESQTYGPYQIDDNSDNMVNSSPNARLNGQYTVTSNGGYANWSGIRQVNYFIVNYSRALAKGVAVADAAPFIGEAYFFRAMYYFNALKSYGALPWISRPLTTADSAQMYAARLPRNIIVDSIVKDLNTAISYLPTKSKASPMRLYKEYAEGYKARVCLYEGTWEKYHANDVFGVKGQDGKAFLQMAADAADSVITSGTFALDNVGVYNGYWKLFNQTDYSSSKEIMFWGAENYTSNGGNSSQWIYQHGSQWGGNNTGMSRSLVNDYLCTDGKPIAVSPLYEGDDSLMHIVANRDPRLAQTMELPGDTVVQQTSATTLTRFTYPAFLSISPCTTGFQLYKGLSTDPTAGPLLGRTSPVPGIIYMRYAEILLIYAEATAELGTITQADIDKSIKLLRDRVGMPDLNMAYANANPDPSLEGEYPNVSGPDKGVILEIRRERRVELACEGYRFDDICRWAAAGSLIKGAMPLGAQVGQFLTVNFGTTGGTQYLKVGSNIFTDNQGYISPYANVSVMANGYQFDLGRDYLSPIDQKDATLLGIQNPGW